MGIISANVSIPTPFASRLTLLTYSRLLMVLTEHGQFDVNLGEYSEYVSLQDGYEDLERVEHHGQGHGDYRDDGTEVQNEPEEYVDDQVPGQDVGVQPHPEREGLGELAQDLNTPHERHHKDLGRQPGRREALQVRPCAVAPEALVLGEDEREQCQHQRKRDVRGDGVGVGDEPHQVKHEDEHEEGEGVREPLPPLLPYLAAEVAPEPVNLLDDHLVGTRPVREQPAPHEQDQERQGSPDPQEPDALGDRDVYRPYVQRYLPGVPGDFEGVQDLLSQRVLTYLGQRNRQASALRSTVASRFNLSASRFMLAWLIFIAPGMSTIFSAR